MRNLIFVPGTEFDCNGLAFALGAQDSPAADLLDEIIRRACNHLVMAHFGRTQPSAQDAFLQAPQNRFDFREFRHFEKVTSDK